ncbi:hypothetical protein FC702_30565, partial [Bacillus cereus]
LGGWSLGGAIAYEIATVLRSQGEEVELLVLMDTKVPSEQDHKTREDMLSYIYEHFIPRDFTEQEEGLIH